VGSLPRTVWRNLVQLSFSFLALQNTIHTLSFTSACLSIFITTSCISTLSLARYRSLPAFSTRIPYSHPPTSPDHPPHQTHHSPTNHPSPQSPSPSAPSSPPTQQQTNPTSSNCYAKTSPPTSPPYFPDPKRNPKQKANHQHPNQPSQHTNSTGKRRTHRTSPPPTWSLRATAFTTRV
jgi:hypothetical protein